MKTVHAIFENGVFRPREPVNLPDNSEVEFEPRLIVKALGAARPESVYEILSRSYETGDPGLAARHNEHQP